MATVSIRPVAGPTALRDELRDELERVTADLAALRERRDELVRRLHACGDSTRAIAELAGMSHTQVRRIIIA